MPFVGSEKITVILRSDVVRDRRGRVQDVNEEVVEDVLATVNPVPGEVLETLPEGERSGDQRRVITEFELRPPDEETGHPGDHLMYRGTRYEVREVQPYRQVIPHLEIRARKIAPGDQRYPGDFGG